MLRNVLVYEVRIHDEDGNIHYGRGLDQRSAMVVAEYFLGHRRPHRVQSYTVEYNGEKIDHYVKLEDLSGDELASHGLNVRVWRVYEADVLEVCSWNILDVDDALEALGIHIED